MKPSKWRVASRRIIQQVLAQHPPPQDKNEARAILKQIDAQYPFGERAYHPYKLWLEERRQVMVQMGLAEPKAKPKRPSRPINPIDSSIIQLSLFDEEFQGQDK